jgi:hypothetical protein
LIKLEEYARNLEEYARNLEESRRIPEICMNISKNPEES